MNNDFIKINPNDNVIVTLRPFSKGEVIDGVTLLNDIPQAHKVAICDIKQGENIIKYGCPIGHASKDIKCGEHVHVHNVKTNLSDVFNYDFKPNYVDFDAPKYDRTIEV